MTSYFAAGDIVWTDFDPTVRARVKPGVSASSFSTRELSENAGFVIVAPITSRVRPFPTSVVLPKGVAIEGEILLHQIRSLDMLARPIRFSGSRIPENAAVEVRTKLD